MKILRPKFFPDEAYNARHKLTFHCVSASVKSGSYMLRNLDCYVDKFVEKHNPVCQLSSSLQ